MKFYFLFPLIATLTLLNTCTENPINGDDNDTPGRRDYVWMIDTIYTPFSNLTKIWGTSPADVWAISSGGDNDKKIFHFDGDKWTNDPNAIPYQPNSIFGFSTSNVWICGGDGKVWHFDGNGWSESATLNVKPSIGISFGDIWGERPNNIYAVGAYTDDSLLFNNGVIAHFDGSNWAVLNSYSNSGNIGRFYKSSGNKYPLVYIWHFDFYGDSTFIYQLDQGNLKNFLEGSFGINSFLTMELINEQIYILKGKEIYLYENDNLKFVLDIDLPNFGQGFSGRSKKDIFLIMNDGIAHYNGDNIEYIYQKNTIMIVGAMIFEKQVIFIAFDRIQGGRNFVIRGILN